jgi:hypothetical protein
MLGEIFSSTQEYLKSKFVNPFLGTLTFVWLLRNWLLVYSLFTFDDNFRWKDKVDFIKGYLANQDFWYEVRTNLWITGVLFISSLAILLITRYLTNLYEFKLLPLTYKYSEEKHLVTKERFNTVYNSSRDKDQTIESLNIAVNKLEEQLRLKNSHIDDLEKKYSESNLLIKSKDELINKLNNEIDDKNTESEDSKVKLVDSSNNYITIKQEEFNEVEISYNPNLDTKTIPQWLKSPNKRRKIKFQIGNFKNSDKYRTLNKTQRLGIDNLEQQNLVFNYLHLVDYLSRSSNVNDYIETGTMDFYRDIDLIQFKYPVLQDEVIVHEVSITKAGQAYFNHLTEGIDIE